MNQYANLPKGADDALAKGYDITEADSADEAQMMAVARQQATEWGELKPSHQDTLPAFPLEVFSPWARGYLAALSRTLQTPTDFAGMFFLGSLALAFQKRYRLTVKPGWLEPLALWVLIAAPSGSRKSQAFREVVAPLNAWQNYMKEEFASIRKSANRRMKMLSNEIEQLRKSRKAPPQLLSDKEEELDELFVPPVPRLFTGTGTPEAIETKLEEHHGRYGLATAESDILSVLIGKYRSGGLPPIEGFLAAWSGEDLRNDFQTRDDVDVTEAHLSMVLATQPRNADDLYNQKKLGGRGAFGRFLTVLPHTEVGDQWIIEAITPEVASYYTTGVGKMLPSFEETVSTYCNRRLETKELHFGPQAMALFSTFFKRTQKRRDPGGDLQFIDEWSAKVCGQCARIAALLHLSDQPGQAPAEISESPVERAVYLTEQYLIPHAKAVMGSAVSGQTEKVWSVLQERAPEIGRRALYKAVKPMLSDELTAVLEELEERNLIRLEKRPSTGGKPPTYILVNPKAPKSLGTKGTKVTKSLKPDFKPFGESLRTGTKSAQSGSLSTLETKCPTLYPLSAPQKSGSEAHNHADNELSNLSDLSALESESELLPEGWDRGLF